MIRWFKHLIEERYYGDLLIWFTIVLVAAFAVYKVVI